MVKFTRDEITAYYRTRVPDLKQTDNAEWRGPCPVHQGTRDSFAVNAKTGQAYCHSECGGPGWDILSLERALTGADFAAAKSEIFHIIGRPEENAHKRRNGASRDNIVDAYSYTDEAGHELFQVVRLEPKNFYQRHRDAAGNWVNSIKDRRRVLYRLPDVISADRVFIVEGEKDVHTLESFGLVATTCPMGAGKWREEYNQFLRDKQVIVVPDQDAKGLEHLAEIQRSVEPVAASFRVIHLNGAKDITAWREIGHTREEFYERVHECSKPSDLQALLEVFTKWLHLPDTGPIKILLAAVVANREPGNPVWLLVIAPPASGKTEFLDSLLGLPNMFSVGTLTEASLLSGSPNREKSKDSTGGLLMEIGKFGMIVCKDFTSVLSMSRELRGPLLAALREICDGSWTRHVGTDGGRALPWKGKVAVLGGCTPVIDQYHSVIASLGERFLLCRIKDGDQKEQIAQGERALDHVGHESEMRAALRTAVTGFLGKIKSKPLKLDRDAKTRLSTLATLTALSRSAVERDSYRREIDLIPGSEKPARLVLALAKLFHGLQTIGVSDEECWRLVTRVAHDCLPVIRRDVLVSLQESGATIDTPTLATQLAYPTVTVRRACEDLAGHKVLTRLAGGKGKADQWKLSDLGKELIEKSQWSVSEKSEGLKR
jgi:5S rRNA maturation endonuclease (ribonuclease M5)